MTPRVLETLTDVVATSQYDPSYPVIVDGIQEIQILYPFFLMSGVGMVSIKGPRFTGYLSSFVPDDGSCTDDPTVVVIVTRAEGC